MANNHLKPKSWGDFRNLVKDSRKQMSLLSSRVPTNFTFRKLNESRTRVYFLCSQVSGRESTIFYADILAGALPLSPSKLQWNLLIDFHQLSNSKVGKDEQLQWERKRIQNTGIVFYEFEPTSNRFLFPAGGTVYTCEDPAEMGAYAIPAEISSRNTNRVNCVLCPHNPDLLAYVSAGDVWVTHLQTGAETKLTHSCKGTGDIRTDFISAGFPSYVIQEEFSRYEGFWWQPKPDVNGVYRILYEEIDENMVDIVTLLGPGGHCIELEQSRFPRAGTANAQSNIRMVSFQLNERKEVFSVVTSDLSQNLQTMFPEMEYLVRVNWTPEGRYVYAILYDRPQKNADLISISVDSFCVTDIASDFTSSSQVPSVFVLHTISNKYWVSLHDFLHFWPVDEARSFRFVWSSEDSGYNHLFYVHTKLEKSSTTNGCDTEIHRTKLQEFVQLTSGDWEVMEGGFEVDTMRGLVFFTASKETPLEKHYYVTSLSEPGVVKRLTKPGYSHTVHISEGASRKIFATVFSNTQSMPACELFNVEITGNLVENISVSSIAFLLETAAPESFFIAPEIFSCEISSGETVYGAIVRPPNRVPGQKYPTLLSIYGGPEVQLVTNSFMSKWQPRLNALVSCGFNVVAIDSRGSNHRGLEFEAALHQRMGSVEIKDQVQVLEWLASREDCIDLARVGIYGWSYGGYLSLMGLAQAPHIFKVAIAGAPVTDWLLYDTGYTERYMGVYTPDSEEVYKRSSVLAYADQFPEEEGRLLIVHGMIDENVHFANTAKLIQALIKAGKPHQLQVYPNERHSMRHLEASEHFETLMLSFLHKNL